MRIIFFGSGEFGTPSLRYLAQDHDVVTVVTQPDRPRGRGRQLSPTPIKSAAGAFGLETQSVENVNSRSFTEALLAHGADLGVVIAFGQKIGGDILEGIRGSCINAHASLLPQYRGAAPIQRAIVDGAEKTGVTVFKLVEKMDAGPILTARWTFIKAEETAAELHDRLAGIAVDALRAALELYKENSDPPGEPQDESRVSLAPKLKKEHGYVTFDKPAREVANHICGMWSWPGARCRFVNHTVKQRTDVILARARPAEGADADVQPGELDRRMYVGTKSGMIEILEIKPAGGSLMSWREFVNGRHVKTGDRFEPLHAE